MQVWRLVREHHRRKPLEGLGASLYGARWNPVGTPVAYCASSLELAVLEALVQVRPEELMGALYRSIEFSLPDDAIQSLDHPPRHWDSPGPYRADVQEVGYNWARSRKSLALRVPSAVLPERDNLLINPAHDRFPEIDETGSGPFSWPRRLLDCLSGLSNRTG